MNRLKQLGSNRLATLGENRLATLDEETDYSLPGIADPSAPPEGFIPSLETEQRKDLITAAKHGYKRAGMMMVKQLSGLSQIESELGGRYREWAWGKLGREKPQYLKKMDKTLGEWGRLMSDSVDYYYRENPQEAIQVSQNAGYWKTLKEYITRPENIVQGIIESSPLILEGILGTVTGGAGIAIPAMAMPISGEVYANARKEGTKPTPALAQALLTGVGEAAIEQWTLGRKLGLAKNFKKLVAGGLPKMLWEGTKAFFRGTAEEGTQEFNRNFWQWVFTDRSQAWMENVRESMAAGGPMELAMAGMFAGAGSVGPMVSNQQKIQRVEAIRQSLPENMPEKQEINKELDKVKEEIKQGKYDERQAAAVAEMEAELAEIQKPARIKPTEPAVAPPVAKVPAKAKIVPPKAAEVKVEPSKLSDKEFPTVYRQYGELTLKAEKDTTRAMTPEERALWQDGKNWEEFSRKRGYSEQEIKNYRYWIKLNKDLRAEGARGFEDLARPAAEAKPTVDKKLLEGWLPKIKTKLIEREVKDLSDAEIKRAFKGTVAENRLIEYAKLMRESGDLKYSDVVAKPKLVDLGPAPEPQILDLSDKTRKAQIKQTEDAINKHEIYSNELEAIGAMTQEIGPGYYYVEPELKGEVLQVTGKPGQKGFKPQLYKSFTFKKDRKATGWDVAAAERGIEDIDIDEFVRRVDEAIQTGKKTGVLNDKALERAIASGDPYFEMLAMKREMLREGLTSAEINDNLKEQAKEYDADVTDLLVPVERVEHVEKKPTVVKDVARKGRQAKARLGTEQAAILKAKTVTRKTKKPVYVYERELGKFTISKSPPKKGTYTKVEPLAEGEIAQKVTEITPPTPTEAQKAAAEKIAKEKGLISHRGRPTQSYRRFAKAMTGKTNIDTMSEEEAAHFIDMMDMLIVGRNGIAKVPTSTDIITKELADKIGKFKEIGALEKIRPAWRVFQKMGLYKEVFEPAFDAEISSIEELFGFRAEAKQMQKLVGKDKPTSQKLFRVIENPGKIKLTSKEAKVVKWGQKYFRDWADRLGLTSEQRRKNYITHIFEREINQILKEKHPLDPDLIRALEFITPKTVFNPYLQKRLGKKVGLKEDFWAAIEAYENRAIKKFYYEPLIKRIRVYQKFLPPNSARYLRNYITRITKRPLTIDREFNQTLKEVAQDIEKLPGGKKLAQHLTKGNAAGMLAYNMTGIYYEAWLGLRPASAIKNLSQHGLILAETGPVAFVKALKTVGTERASLLLNSKALRSRKSGYLPGIDQTYIKNLESKRRKITMAMFRAADRKNVSDAFLAGYHEAKAKGLSNEWAFKRGDEVAAKTQWLYSKLAGAEFMQTSPGRVLGVLTTWPENWAELMNDWIRAKPSQVYTDYAKETGKEIPKVNWVKRRKSLWTYLALVSLAMLIHKKTPFKALYYTGWTSIKSLVDIASGKLAGLEIPRIVGNLIVGLALGDKRRLKQSWNEMKRFVVIVRELTDIITGKKDWLNLFVYLETEKERGKKAPTSPTRPTRPTRPKRPTR